MNHTDRKQIVNFFGKLGAMLSAGVRFTDALDSFNQYPLPGAYKEVPAKLATGLREGQSFSALLETYQNLFSRQIIAMLKVGEKKGYLDVALTNLSKKLDEGLLELTGNEEDCCVEEICPPGHDKLLGFLEMAQREKASDLHIECTKTGGRVRLRIDGRLVEQTTISSTELKEIIAAAKITFGCDPADHRLPQDGSVCMAVGKKSNQLMRLCCMPFTNGESCLIRLLSGCSKSDMVSLDDLFQNHKTLEKVRKAALKPHGLFVISGPTGSGKTTTYYSLLAERDTEAEKIISLEDPVEFSMPGIQQLAIDHQIGLTFSKALRSTLRNDADVIGVGEVRDVETAEIILQAALSGHMVFTSLHGNDAVSSLLRLVNIGLEPTRIADCLQGILGQQLVRKLCENCKEAINKSEEPVGKDFTSYRAKGCEKCNKGYKGRVAVHEFLPMSSKLANALVKEPSYNELYNAAAADGFMSFWSDGVALWKKGLTTMEELKRILPKRESISSTMASHPQK